MAGSLSPSTISTKLQQVAELARKAPELVFTTLAHHIDIECLREAYRRTRKDGATGIDGQTAAEYAANLEANLQSLLDRLKSGTYRAPAVRRVHIPKGDGKKTRPLGIPTFEDKVLQRAVAMLLEAVCEPDFLDCSYGFRPGRAAHQALEVLWKGLMDMGGAVVIDVDIQGYFDTLQHRWLMKFVEHRVADRRIVRLIQKWSRAGVLEEGRRIQSEVGAVQGGSISLLLANIYLHYGFDLWTRRWRKKPAHGQVIIVRYADDFVVGVEHRHEAEQFLVDLKQRFSQFGVELHPEKTRLIECGRFAASHRDRRGRGKPETFDFLGFTHRCGKTRKTGSLVVLRRTMRKRMTTKLQAVKEELRRRRHTTIGEQGKYLRAVVQGHVQYYAVPRNMPARKAVRRAIGRLWWKSLARSQRGRITWERMARILKYSLPRVRICHPYPSLPPLVRT